MSARWFYTLVGLAALGAGTALWLANRPPAPASVVPTTSAPTIGAAAVYATPFSDTAGRPVSLGQFQGKLVVLNFWATWCAPCLKEMPAFERVQARWKDRGVQFVGVSAEDAALVERFRKQVGVTYPLWVGDAASELTRRLGNTAGVLPHSVILAPGGRVLEQKVGPYSEDELEGKLNVFSGKTS